MKRAASFLVGILLLVTGLVLRTPNGSALTMDSARDCDSNAVINCGALNFTELQNRFSQPGVADIFSHFGISDQDINNIGNTAVEGVVTNKNNVWIHRSSGLCPDIDQNSLSSENKTATQNNPNLCLVATNAMTAGRQNITGSTAMNVNGTDFFMRPPSVSFASSSLPAFVVMNNGRFAFAIIASCGNPVNATPVPVVTTTVHPVKPSPTTTPTTTSSSSSSATANANATVSVTTPSVQAATTTAMTPVQPVATKALPNTGPGNILAISGATTAIGSIGHWYYSRARRS